MSEVRLETDYIFTCLYILYITFVKCLRIL